MNDNNFLNYNITYEVKVIVFRAKSEKLPDIDNIPYDIVVVVVSNLNFNIGVAHVPTEWLMQL